MVAKVSWLAAALVVCLFCLANGVAAVLPEDGPEQTALAPRHKHRFADALYNSLKGTVQTIERPRQHVFSDDVKIHVTLSTTFVDAMLQGGRASAWRDKFQTGLGDAFNMEDAQLVHVVFPRKVVEDRLLAMVVLERSVIQEITAAFIVSVSLLYNEIAKEGELVLLLLTSIIYYVLMRLHGMSYADMMGYVAVEKELRHGLRAESFSTTSPSKKFYEDLAMSILGAPREWEEYKTILEDRNVVIDVYDKNFQKVSLTKATGHWPKVTTSVFEALGIATKGEQSRYAWRLRAMEVIASVSHAIVLPTFVTPGNHASLAFHILLAIVMNRWAAGIGRDVADARECRELDEMFKELDETDALNTETDASSVERSVGAEYTRPTGAVRRRIPFDLSGSLDNQRIREVFDDEDSTAN